MQMPRVPRLRLPSFPGFRRKRPTTPLRFCPECGALLGRTPAVGAPCPACGVTLASVLDAPQTSVDPGRQAALQGAVDGRVQQGWYIVRQREDFVEMRKPKRRPHPAVLLGSIAAGVALPGSFLLWGGAYLAWHALSDEAAVYFFVGADGAVAEERAR